MDGGTVYNTDANNGVQACLDAGYAEEDIVMDIVICGTGDIYTTESDISKNALRNWWRYETLKRTTHSTNQVLSTYTAYPNV